MLQTTGGEGIGFSSTLDGYPSLNSASFCLLMLEGMGYTDVIGRLSNTIICFVRGCERGAGYMLSNTLTPYLLAIRCPDISAAAKVHFS